MRNADALERLIDSLLEDPVHRGHPLRSALEELYSRYQDGQRQIDRISHIADRYQHAERARGQGFADNYQRKLRQLEKIVRISDQYQNMLRDVNERLQWLSSRDELTGLPNRRFMLNHLNEQLRKLDRIGAPFCVALVDIDHFKAINDTYGHDVGDNVLATVATALRESLRADDACGRWGGEEFLLIMPGAILAAAEGTLARMRQNVSAIPKPEQGQHDLRLTVSVGLISCQQPGDAPNLILKRVDDALYAAKRQGRDRTVIG